MTTSKRGSVAESRGKGGDQERDATAKPENRCFDDGDVANTPKFDPQLCPRGSLNGYSVVAAILAAILAILVSHFVSQLFDYWEELEKESQKGCGDVDDLSAATVVASSDYATANNFKPNIFQVSIDERCHLSVGRCAGLDYSRLITDEMRSAFKRDGVIAIRGLIPPDLASSLDAASSELTGVEYKKRGVAMKGRGSGKQFHTVHMGAIYLDPPDENGKATDDTGDYSHGVEANQKNLSAFRDVALHSAVPMAAAELMGTKTGTTMRMLRDVFLAKDEEEYVCGWHVDDFGFWPANPTSDGINAWIAIDDMPVKRGGGFALAVGSHAADWRMDAHRAVGSTMTYPSEGFHNAADMFENRTGAGTCNLATAAPELNAKMEESKRIYDIEAGDVIFHERWLFHRTVPFNRNVVHHWRGRYRGYRAGYEDAPPPQLLNRRYSVRYARGTAELPKGYGSELAILWDSDNAGRSLDDVVEKDGPWYPRCWPSVSVGEMKQMGRLVAEKLLVTKKRQDDRMKEMRPYLNDLSRRQQRAKA